MKYILDTNMCIYIIKKHPIAVLNRLEECVVEDMCLSAITTAELWYGVEKSQHKEKKRECAVAVLKSF